MSGCGQQEWGQTSHSHEGVPPGYPMSPLPGTYHSPCAAARQPGPLRGPVLPCTLLQLSVLTCLLRGVASMLPPSTAPSFPQIPPTRLLQKLSPVCVCGGGYFLLGQNGHICSPGYPATEDTPSRWLVSSAHDSVSSHSFLISGRFLKNVRNIILKTNT